MRKTIHYIQNTSKYDLDDFVDHFLAESWTHIKTVINVAQETILMFEMEAKLAEKIQQTGDP